MNNDSNSTIVAELIADKITHAGHEVADKVASKIVQSNEVTATTLAKVNNKMEKLTYVQVALSVVTLVLLVAFAVAFFEYAIVVTVK
jgi:hypothetical protein